MTLNFKKTKQKRKPIGIRNGIKIYSKLQGKTPLKFRTKLRPVSKKQAVKNSNWTKITEDRCKEEDYFCQWCHGKGNRIKGDYKYLDGHHEIPRRNNIHTPEICYIVHRFECHRQITDENVDTRLYKDKEAWERREK